MKRWTIAIFFVACGGSQHGGSSDVAPIVKTYAPLAFKADATSPHQAVILGTDGDGGSTVIQLRTTGHPIVVPASATLAAMTAATALDKDLADFAFAPTPAPVASALVAAEALAAMTGAAIDPSATILGTIWLDGQIGPASGIPAAMVAALASGKRRIGYPIGMRFSRAGNVGTDFVTLARADGAEAIEIADLDQAYHVLTGKPFPTMQPVAESDMALDPRTAAALEAHYKAWQQNVAIEWPEIIELETAGRLPPLLGELRERAQHDAQLAERFHGHGKVAAAYSKMLSAWVFASATTQAYDLVAKVSAGDAAAIDTELSQLAQLDQRTAAAFEEIGARRPATLGGELQAISAFEAAIRGWAFEFGASRELQTTTDMLHKLAADASQRGSPQIADPLVHQIAPLLLDLDRTIAEITRATESLDLEAVPNTSHSVSPNLRRTATALQTAALAAVAELSATDDDGLVATLAAKLSGAGGLPLQLETSWGNTSSAWSLMVLAGGELAYFDSARRLARSAFGIRTDDSGKVIAIVRDQAFVAALANAEHRARANAHAAQIATGAIPVQAKFAYELAQTESDGDLSEQVDALWNYWASTAASQTAVLLARN